jgi:hypothetical protein
MPHSFENITAVTAVRAPPGVLKVAEGFFLGPGHFGEPLRQHCLCCHRQGLWLDGRHGDEVHCKDCAVALHQWLRVKPAPLSASLQVTLQLESTLIDCLRGQPPDSLWVGPVDAEAFVSLAADLNRPWIGYVTCRLASPSSS